MKNKIEILKKKTRNDWIYKKIQAFIALGNSDTVSESNERETNAI